MMLYLDVVPIHANMVECVSKLGTTSIVTAKAPDTLEQFAIPVRIYSSNGYVLKIIF